MSNVKVGDLAIVVGSSVNAGIIVKVMRSEILQDRPDALAWEVRADRPFKAHIVFEGKRIADYDDTVAICPDSWLRPVSGLPVMGETDLAVPA